MKDKVFLITGASRGIGKAIALRLAREGASIVIAAKTASPHPKLEGTIHSAAEEIEKAGGKALAVETDVRSEESVGALFEKALTKFGRLDGLVNNASAINLTPTLQTEMKKFDLMFSVNVRATFMCSKFAIPHLAKAGGHILNLSPPLNMEAKWFAPHVAYTMSKYGMSLCVLGMAEELRSKKISVCALWPRTTIATAAVMNLLGGETLIKRSRKPAIVADAAFEYFKTEPGKLTGQFLVDEDFLKAHGVTEFGDYSVTPGSSLQPDFFL